LRLDTAGTLTANDKTFPTIAFYNIVVDPEWWGAVINASGTECGSALMTRVKYSLKEMPNGLCRNAFLDKSPDGMPY
jgi:hypothetical protein